MKITELVRESSWDEFLSKSLGDVTGGGSVSSLLSKSSDNSASSSKPDNKTDVSKPYIGYKTGKMIRPVDAKPGSPFGPRHGEAHNGTDFPVPTGTPVKAPEDGVVKKTGSDRANGNHVVISSGNNEHWLLHLSKINVSAGQKVNQGDIVGLSGSTGRSTGPHLHWEVHVAGRPVDPTTVA